MIDLCYWLYVLTPVVTRTSDILSYLFYNCKPWFVWVVVQRGCVLGLCHKALDQHRRMLRLAQWGSELNRHIIKNVTIQGSALFSSCILTCLKRLKLQHIRFLDTLVTQ